MKREDIEIWAGKPTYSNEGTKLYFKDSSTLVGTFIYPVMKNELFEKNIWEFKVKQSGKITEINGDDIKDNGIEINKRYLFGL